MNTMTSLWTRLRHRALGTLWGRPVRFEKNFLCRGSTGNAIAASDNLRGTVRVVGGDVQLKIFEQAFFFSPERSRALAALLIEAAAVAPIVDDAAEPQSQASGETS